MGRRSSRATVTDDKTLAMVDVLERRVLLAAADLDTSFDMDGVAITDHAGLSEQFMSAALAPDGRLVLAGTSSNATTGQDFVVVRLLENGSPDGTFNRGTGRVQTDYNNENNRVDGAVVQPDGKIVVVGATYTRSIIGSPAAKFLVVRYRVDGTLDTTFGNGGRVVIGDFVTGDDAYPSDVIIQPDGKIVVSGSGRINDYLVARLLPNGQLDSSFGGGDGKVVTKPEGVTTLADSEDLALAPDGKLIVVGHVGLPDAGGFGVIKLNSDGSLDTTFGGGDGKVTTTFTEDASAGGRAVGVYGDGKFVVGGYVGGFDKFALARYNANGSLDNTFSSDGRVVTDLPGTGAIVMALRVLSDGKVLAVGSTGLGENQKGAAIVRYNYNGSMDTSFSGDGIVTTNYGLTQVRPDDMAVRSDGRFIVAAKSYMEDEPFDYRFVTVQYQGGTPPNGAWIAGRIYEDGDRNNQFNAGDVPIAGARVFIDADNDSTYDIGEKSVLTNAEGQYEFTFLAAGDYRWGVVPPAGFEPYLSSGFYSLPLGAGQQLGGKDIALVEKQQVPPQGTSGNDTFLVRRDASGNYFEIYDSATASGSPVYRVLRSTVSKYVFDFLGGDDLLVIDATNGNPIPSGNMTITGGDGHDVVRLVGSAAADDILVGHTYAAFGFSPTLNHAEIEDVQVDGAGGWDNLQVTVGRASLVGAQDFQNIKLFRGTSLVLPASGSNTLQVRGLTMEADSRLDIHDNDLVLHPFSPTQTLPTLRGYLEAARNSTPQWSKGLTSSNAMNDPLTGLAFVVGQRPVGSDYVPIRIRHAYNGDINLDGRINADDYFAIDSGFLAQPPSPAYAQGDFNHDAKVNADDYFLIDSAFLGQRAALTGGVEPSQLVSAAAAPTRASIGDVFAVRRKRSRR